MSELKVCPFCESVDDVDVWEQKYTNEDITYKPFCGVCGCELMEYKTREEAIDKWNARPIEDALQKRVEGKGFETAMKRVVDENKGAWKALADGEEGKG